MRTTMLVAIGLMLDPTSAPALAPEEGKLVVRPVGDEAKLPERYRLENYSFDWKLVPKRDLPVSGVAIYTLTYPSPVKTPELENNTVWAEYYRPHGDGPFPGVLVLDILGGDQELSRTISRHLAQNGIA